MTELIECPICKKPIASSVKRCPGCGARLSKTQKFNARRVDADGNQVIPKNRRVVCKKCKTVYDMAEDRCPNCGEKNSSWKIGCLVILAVCVFIGFLFSKLPEPATDTAAAEKSKTEISYKVEKTKGQQNFISISKEDVTEEKLELLGEKLKKKYSNPVQVFIFDDAEIAKALYLGIVHDTGVFQYSNTTPRRQKSTLWGFTGTQASGTTSRSCLTE
mgnify:CR=1 FL=1